MPNEAPHHAPLSTEAVSRIIDETFPEIHAAGRQITIESVGMRWARVRLTFDPSHLRPGGTVSGPAMFTLADFTIYVALIATLGEIGIPAVTSNLSINFLLRPEPADVVAEAKLLRIGRRLAYAEVALYSDGRSDMIAHATASYAIPSSK
ncbi:MAG: PaaI family thioesterase [Hyphomicrobiaceae bacterium]